MNHIIPLLTRIAAALAGILWCWIEPALPYARICVLAVLIDCLTAWRLNRRIRSTYSKEVADGKLKSSHMSKMISDLIVVFLCIILAQHVDDTLLAHLGGIHLGSYVAAIFCLTQFVSILENESSCNGSTWAIVLQKVLADKTSRHLEIETTRFEQMRAEQQERDRQRFGNQASEE
jgi:hypothetical protein